MCISAGLNVSMYITFMPDVARRGWNWSYECLQTISFEYWELILGLLQE